MKLNFSGQFTKAAIRLANLRIVLLRASVFCLGLLSWQSTSAEPSSAPNLLAKFIVAYSNASEYCDGFARGRPAPSREALGGFPKLSKKQMFGFLVYKAEVAKWNCIEKHADINLVVLVHLIVQERDERRAETAIRSFADLISNRKLLEAFDLFLTISRERRQELESYTYFDEPFDYFVVNHALSQYIEGDPG